MTATVLYAHFVYGLFLGLLIGYAERWNKKFVVIGMLVVALAVVISGAIVGVEAIAGTLKWWELLAEVIGAALGIASGRVVYDEVN